MSRDDFDEDAYKAFGPYHDGLSPLEFEACDRRGCKAFATSVCACDECDKSYRRCKDHGDLDGVTRSLRAHRLMFHAGSK